MCEFSIPKCGGVLGGNGQDGAEKQNVVLTWFRLMTLSSGLEVPRGPGRRSPGARSQKVSKKSRKSLLDLGSRKSEKSLEKGPKSQKKSENGFFLTFRTFFATFFRLSGPRARETFSRLFGFGPRDSFSQVHGTSSPVILVADIHQRAFQVFAGDPFTQRWCIDSGFLK